MPLKRVYAFLFVLLVFLLAGALPLPAQTLRGVKAIAASGEYSLALLSDGTVWGWGFNRNGELGDGTLTNRSLPVQAKDISSVVAISPGLAVKADGTVLQWGANLGPLGNEIAVNNTPVQVSELSGVVAVSGGSTSNLALKADGTVWAWGINWAGELGSGVAPQTVALLGRSIPVAVSGLTDIVAVAIGCVHSLALKRDGTVWAWGGNNDGMLGDALTPPPPLTGALPDRPTPAPVSGLSDIVAVAAGQSHSLALRGDGTVWAWGSNGHGQLGDGTTQTTTTPVQVGGLTGVVRIAAGSAHSIAVKRDGTVWAWGSNAAGQLGDGTTTDRLAATQTTGVSGISAVAAGLFHGLALHDDGTVWAWGRNEYGQLGDGVLARPVQVAEVSGVRKVAAGASHSLALKDDGTLWVWGDNSYGQLGDGTRTDWSLPGRAKPMPVSGLPRVAAIAGGYIYSLAVTDDGSVWDWGANTWAVETRPVRLSELAGVVSVASGSGYNLATQANGSLWNWGQAWFPLDPAPMNGVSDVAATATDLARNVALIRDGTVWEWGYWGTTPEPVRGLSEVVAVGVGCYDLWFSCHSLALKHDGTVWAWGSNDAGQLGDGTTTDRMTPIEVSGVNDVVAIAARAGGTPHNLAVKSDGTVWEWPTAERLTPVQVAGLSDVVAVAEGVEHSLALTHDGSVWAWGSNEHGQLGVETIRTTPVQVVIPAME